MSRSDWIGVAVALILTAFSYFYAGRTSAVLVLAIGVAILWRMRVWEPPSSSRKDDWRLLESKFSRYPRELKASWMRVVGRLPSNWTIEGSDGRLQKQELSALMERAGRLVAKSQFARKSFTESLSAGEPIDKWLNVVCAITKRGTPACGGTRSHGVTIETYGYISELPQLCALACAQLAAKEN